MLSLTTHPPAQQIGFLLREIVELPSLRADPRAHWDGGSFIFAALRHQIDKTAHSFADHAGPIESANMYVFRLIIVRYVLLGGALPSLLRYRNFLFSFRFSGSDITQRLKIPLLRYDLPEKYSALRSNRSVPPIESALHSRIRRSNKGARAGSFAQGGGAGTFGVYRSQPRRPRRTRSTCPCRV